jgi:hypothetical protein
MRTGDSALPAPLDRTDRLHPGVERAQCRSQLLQLRARQVDERRAEPPERFDIHDRASIQTLCATPRMLFRYQNKPETTRFSDMAK